MARGPWVRCPWTGISKRKLKQIGETFLYDEGGFNPETYPDCDIFDVRSFAAAAGYKDVPHFVTTVVTDQSSPFHARQIRTESGRLLSLATDTTSAEAGGIAFRKLTSEKRKKKLKQFQD